MASITSKGIDIEKKEIFQGFGKPPPEGLIPVGDSGIYLSPNIAKNKEVSPFDCEQWPDSPYCGGVPWTKTPIGFDLDFGFDGCGAWVQGTPIVGFTKLPQVSAAWRREGECRDRMQPDVKDKILEDIGESVAPEFPSGISRDARVLAVFAYDHYSRYSGIQWPGINWVRKETRIEKYLGKTIPGDFDMILGQNPTLIRSLCTTRHSYVRTVDYTETKSTGETTATQVVETGEFMANMHPNHPYWSQTANNGRRFTHSVTHIGPSQTIWGYAIQDDTFNDYIYSTYVHGIYGDIVDYYSRWNLGQVYGGVDYFYVNCRLVDLYVFDWGSQPPKAPPPDYKKRKCDCMQCCGSGQAQDRRKDQDNAEILKLLKEIKKAVGVDDLPVKMPTSLISKDEGFIGNLIPNAPASEDSIPKLLTRFIRYFDEVMGQWEIPIEIKDADPLTPGDQPKGVKLHNIAECLADMYAMQFDNYLITQQLMHLNSKTLIEQGLTKQNVVQNYYALLCLIDFFGFKYKEIDADVPLSFKAGESRFEDFIKDSEQRIKVFDLDVNDKNVVTYKDDMTVLYQMAQIIKAVHFRKLDHKGDMKQQILDLVKFASQYLGKVEGGEIDPSGNKKDDFQDWLEDAETEFSRKTGINTQNPYGRPYDQRPRLTILDVDNPTQD